jgi:HK97 gp10 family phage protein
VAVRVSGKSELDKFLATLPQKLEKDILRGAVKAGAEVVAAEAAFRTNSHEVAASIKVRTATEKGIVTAKVETVGPGAYLAPWEEYGTAAHFITVQDSARGGATVGRINRKLKEGSLVIGGQFVGQSVLHPGARPHPFLLPAFDTKQSEAVAVMGEYVRSRLSEAGFGAPFTESGDA